MLFKHTLLFLLLIPIALCARPGYTPPWGKDADLIVREPSDEKTPSRSLVVKTAETIIHFHQNVLSPVDGPRSHYYPSSSHYMLDAIHKYGFFKGFIMGCDRLLRENEEKWCYKTIEHEGRLLKYDPVP